MGEEQPRLDDTEDIFADHAEWLAAQVRQLFRANEARDTKAVEVALCYLLDHVEKVLRRHLSKHDAAWDNALLPLNSASARWFDGLSAEPEYPAPGCLRLRGDIYWLTEQYPGYYDPLDFQIELCPKTGAFKRYVFRFGDSRPLSDKLEHCPIPGYPVGKWAYEFERRRAE